jgi:hypothetical protein
MSTGVCDEGCERIPHLATSEEGPLFAPNLQGHEGAQLLSGLAVQS